MLDPSGEIAVTTIIFIVSAVAGAIVAGYTACTSYKYTGEIDWENTILSGMSTFCFCYSCGMSAYGMYLSYCVKSNLIHYLLIVNFLLLQASMPDRLNLSPDLHGYSS